MSEKTLREKYGGKLAKAINRAIRAEIPGGNEALDKLTVLAGAARQSHWKDDEGDHTVESKAYYRHQRDVIDVMEAKIREKWDIPPSEQSLIREASRPQKRPGSPRSAQGGGPARRGNKGSAKPRR